VEVFKTFKYCEIQLKHSVVRYVTKGNSGNRTFLRTRIETMTVILRPRLFETKPSHNWTKKMKYCIVGFNVPLNTLYSSFGDDLRVT